VCASVQEGEKDKDDVAAPVLLAFEDDGKDGEGVTVLVLVPEQSSNHSYVLTRGWIRFVTFSQVVTSTGGGVYENWRLFIECMKRTRSDSVGAWNWRTRKRKVLAIVLCVTAAVLVASRPLACALLGSASLEVESDTLHHTTNN
jgi:hypothetical protein